MLANSRAKGNPYFPKQIPVHLRTAFRMRLLTALWGATHQHYPVIYTSGQSATHSFALFSNSSTSILSETHPSASCSRLIHQHHTDSLVSRISRLIPLTGYVRGLFSNRPGCLIAPAELLPPKEPAQAPFPLQSPFPTAALPQGRADRPVTAECQSSSSSNGPSGSAD
ncbi:hypothetical protein SAMN05216191_115110 [Paenibacillus jilunlii]|uniref:Uncharacterized protein n=1 Tax=Paenibacillus jilunlii TaxID=682956 RepID=A0A1G9UXC0_9BACL|nr:hypothetical protein SAMN05216191_115110 [Paenibacillus jilunlii]